MQIVRPPEGFHLIERPEVRSTLEELKDQCPWLEIAYANLIARLKIAAHLMGQPSREGHPYRHFVEADPETGQRRLAVSYKVLGDALTVLAIKVLVTD